MRWVALTPTFAAGLGIVVAAAMAAPARTVVLSMGPHARPCAIPGCRGRAGAGKVASKPGGTKRLVIPARVPTPGTSRSAGVSGAGRDVLVQYRTVGQDHSGNFVGQLILASRTGRPLHNWVLQFSYPGQIRIWGGPPQPAGQHTVTVTAGQYPYGGGWAGWSGGRIVQIVFSVPGQAGPPASCTVNGQPCRYTSSLPSQDQPQGGYGGGYSGGYSGGYGGSSSGGYTG